MARIDGDGLVCILDRVKDMINRGGEKIFGLEVENVLYAFPGVAEAAIVGVPHPVFGEVPVAYLVPMPGERIDPEKVRDFCRTRLADFKVPVEVRLTDKLPRNPGGKVVKQQLKRQWMENERRTTPAERVIGIELTAMRSGTPRMRFGAHRYRVYSTYVGTAVVEDIKISQEISRGDRG